MKKLFIFIILLLFPTFTLADDITSTSTIYVNDEKGNIKLTDNNENSYITINKDIEVKITNDNDIDGLYIIYELKSMTGSISNENKNNKIGENNFLHEYIDVGNKIGKSKEIVLKYDDDVKIAEIYILSEGVLPEFVEVWEPPCNEADLLLLSTHSDDEQLFFLGLLPTYVAKGASVQVAYFVNHFDNPKRLHEQLHGLYVVGIRNYPIIGGIPDAYSESLDGAISNMKRAGLTLDDATNFQVEVIRRFKPLVVVGHDELGEYKHGQHILNTHTLKIALEKTNDETYHEDSFKKYGVWDVPKTYLHLYKENQIIMDYDTPLDYFNGKTAYEVSKEGYSKHHSQQWTWFTAWINGKNNEYTKSTDITKYSPNEFGLYRSLVGEDIEKNDMFENLTFRFLEEDEEKDATNITINDMIDNIKNIKGSTLTKYKPYIIGGSILLIVIILILVKKNKAHK